MKAEDAEEYTQALGQVMSGVAASLEGGWRLRAQAWKLGVPQALGLSVQEWSERVDAPFVRMAVTERREASVELKADGFSNRETAAILGVDESTIRADLSAGNPAPAPAPKQVEPIPAMASAGNPAPAPLEQPEVAALASEPPSSPLSPEEKARLRKIQQEEEERRQRRVATHLMCETVVALAQVDGGKVATQYDPNEAAPGRPVTRQVIQAAISSLEEIARIWKERELA